MHIFVQKKHQRIKSFSKLFMFLAKVFFVSCLYIFFAALEQALVDARIWTRKCVT